MNEETESEEKDVPLKIKQKPGRKKKSESMATRDPDDEEMMLDEGFVRALDRGRYE